MEKEEIKTSFIHLGELKTFEVFGVDIDEVDAIVIPKIFVSCLKDKTQLLYIEKNDTTYIHFDEKNTNLLKDIRVQIEKCWKKACENNDDEKKIIFEVMNQQMRFKVEHLKIE